MIEHDACVSSLHTISFERQFGHSITDVWDAVSDESQVATWMEYPTRLKPELGTSVLIDFSPEEPIRGVVCTVEAEKLLAHTWQNSIVRWELSGGAAPSC